MTDERHRLLDICIKMIAALVTLAGIWFGYKQFLAQFELSNKRPFLELQAKYYIEMLEVVSRITYPADDKDRRDSTRRFWQALQRHVCSSRRCDSGRQNQFSERLHSANWRQVQPGRP